MIDLDELERDGKVYGLRLTDEQTLALIAELRAAREVLECAERASKIELGITRTDIGNAMLSELRRALARHAKGAL